MPFYQSPRLPCTPVLPGPFAAVSPPCTRIPGEVSLRTTSLCPPCVGCPNGFHASMYQHAYSMCMAPEGSPAPCAAEEGISPHMSAETLSTPSPPHSSSSGGSPDAAQGEAAYSRQKLKGKAVMRLGEARLQSVPCGDGSHWGTSRPERPGLAWPACNGPAVLSPYGALGAWACLVVVASHT